MIIHFFKCVNCSNFIKIQFFILFSFWFVFCSRSYHHLPPCVDNPVELPAGPSRAAPSTPTVGRRTHNEDPALHAGQPLDVLPVHPADQPLQGLAGERTLDIVGQKIQFPKSFEKLKITASIVKDNMHSLKSFDSFVNIILIIFKSFIWKYFKTNHFSLIKACFVNMCLMY